MSFSTWFRQAAVVAILASFCTAANAASEIAVRWTFELTGPTFVDVQNQATFGPVSPPEQQKDGSWFGEASGVHAAATSDWSSPSGFGSGESFSSNGWAANDYYQFKTTTVGLDEIGIGFDQTGSGTGPRDFKLEYSTDGTNFTSTGIAAGGEYDVLLNGGTPNPAWSQLATRTTAYQYLFDLTSITALNNQADVYFRLTATSNTSINNAAIGATGTNRVDNFTIMHNYDGSFPEIPPFVPIPPDPPNPPGVLTRPKDVVIGLNSSINANTLEIVRGPLAASPSGGAVQPEPWYLNSFVQSVEFDNYDGQLHNARGNLLGVDFGPNGGTGRILSFATRESPAPAAQVIGNTGDPAGVGRIGQTSFPTTRLAGLSIAPDNSKVAVTGYDNGTVMVYTYNDGDTHGAGASLSQGRKTADNAFPSLITQGTAWLDANTVVILAASPDFGTGEFYEIDASGLGTLTPVFAGDVPAHYIGGTGREFTSLYYNPDVSEHLYAMMSDFVPAIPPSEEDPDGTPSDSTNTLYVVDPDDYSLVHEIDLTTSFGGNDGDSGREIALDPDGNLFIGAFGTKVYYMTAADLAAGTDNSAVLWYDGTNNSSFNGLDVGHGEPGNPDGDFNLDGKVDSADYVMWRKTNPGDMTAYNLWKTNFGASLAGSGGGTGNGGVPEPASLVLVVIGMTALCIRRRSA